MLRRLSVQEFVRRVLFDKETTTNARSTSLSAPSAAGPPPWALMSLVATALAGAPASAQQTLPFNATYIGPANVSGPDANGFLTVTSRLFNPLASFGLTEADFSQTVFVFSDPNLIVGTSVFQQFGGGPDKLFTSYSGTSTPFDPPKGSLRLEPLGHLHVHRGGGPLRWGDRRGHLHGDGQDRGQRDGCECQLSGTSRPGPRSPHDRQPRPAAGLRVGRDHRRVPAPGLARMAGLGLRRVLPLPVHARERTCIPRPDPGGPRHCAVHGLVSRHRA